MTVYIKQDALDEAINMGFRGETRNVVCKTFQLCRNRFVLKMTLTFSDGRMQISKPAASAPLFFSLGFWEKCAHFLTDAEFDSERNVSTARYTVPFGRTQVRVSG